MMRIKKVMPLLRRGTSVLFLLAVILICSLLSPAFFTTQNAINVARQISVVTILAFGQTMLIIAGQIDLSVGAVAGMAGVFSCIFYLNVPSLVLALLFGVLLGGLFGIFNGLVITRFKAPPFIVTLAMQTVATGIILLYTGGQNVYNIGDFRLWGQGSIGILPVPVLIMLVVLVIVYLILHHMKFGRYLYAIGGNEKAAEASGIQVGRTKFIAYVMSGMLAGLAGVLLMSRLNSGMPSAGTGYETDAIMAAVIGGTSFTGGVGTAFGTLIGSMIIGILNNILNLMGVQSYVQQISKGLLIVIAVVIDIKTKTRKQ